MKLGSVLLSTIPDLLLVCGFVLLIYGVNLIYNPASYITAGFILLFAFYPRANRSNKANARRDK